MKYDFISIIDRHNMDAIAVDGLGTGGVRPAKPQEGFDVIPMWVEVIHGRNVDNDCKMTFNQKILSNPKILMDNFEIPRRISPIQSKIGFFTFLIPAFMAQFTHRLASKLIGNK